MQVDPQEFRRRFEELSDDALLEVKRDELVPVARDLYDAELTRRGLKAPSESSPAESADAEPASPEEEMVPAGEFSSQQEVAFARSLLKSAGIPTYVKTDFSGVLAATEENLDVFVPASMLQQAQELLATPLSDEDLAAQAEAAGSAEEIEEAELEAASETGEEPADKDKDIDL